MNIFELREQLVRDYGDFIRGFLKISDSRLDEFVHSELERGVLWPEPWISLNPSFESGGQIDDLVDSGVLEETCRRIFRIKTEGDPRGRELRLHRHQAEAIDAAASEDNYVLTTGTGSGKSLGYAVPIVNHVLSQGSGQGIKALIIYPMNALANSQENELKKFLETGFPAGQPPVTFARYTGQDDDEKRREIIAHPPDILLTNYVMAELILTRVHEKGLVRAAQGLQFLVLDELHTYRGRQGADVAMLIRRIRDACAAERLQCIGTSATLASGGTIDEQRDEIAKVAGRLFGSPVRPDRVIGETLRRVTAEIAEHDAGVRAQLAARVADPRLPSTFEDFIADPLASWIEDTFGLRSDEDADRLVRQDPRRIGGPNGAAAELAQLVGVDEDAATTAIREALLAGCRVIDLDTQRPVFAFRLHQFVTRGDTAYASLQSELERKITMQAQTFDPSDPNRERILLPLVFCRECGQEYYAAARRPPDEGIEEPARLLPRGLGDQAPEVGDAGFLYLSSAHPWPLDEATYRSQLPDDWVEETAAGDRVRADRREWVPQAVGVHPDGRLGSYGEPGTLTGHWVPTPFRFCLHCGVAYSFTTRSDISKLTTLGLEGRSTATTMLSLSILRYLRDHGAEAGIPEKLLTFTDNRQDASLQAGHFNDFVQVSLLRTALVQRGGRGGVRRHHARRAGPASLRCPGSRHLRVRARRLRPLRGSARTPAAPCGRSLRTACTPINAAGGGSPPPTSSRRGCCRSTTARLPSSAGPRRTGRTPTRCWPQRLLRSGRRWPGACWTTCAASSPSRSTTSTPEPRNR